MAHRLTLLPLVLPVAFAVAVPAVAQGLADPTRPPHFEPPGAAAREAAADSANRLPQGRGVVIGPGVRLVLLDGQWRKVGEEAGGGVVAHIGRDVVLLGLPEGEKRHFPLLDPDEGPVVTISRIHLPLKR